MPGQPDLKPQLRLRRDLPMRCFESRHQFFDVSVEKRVQAPDVFSDLQDRDSVLLRLGKGRPDQQPTSFGRFKGSPQVTGIPGVHLVHGMDRLIERPDLSSGMPTQKRPASAQHKMIVQIRLGAAAHSCKIPPDQRISKFHGSSFANRKL